MVKIKEFTKHISVYVEFDTESIGFGGNHLTYMGSKTYGNTKKQQKQDIISQLKLNVIQLLTAITELEEK
tara:strand:- start:174 stop:383 length:210 start_codon:yes stop_codon:yes gene_type:complete